LEPVDLSIASSRWRQLHVWMREPSLTRNVFSNWANTAATILYTLIITPIVVRALGSEMYGVWSFINGFLAYSDLLYLGLGTALIRYVAEYVQRRDLEGLGRLVSVVWTIYVGVGILAMLIAIGVGIYLPTFFPGKVGISRTVALWTCGLLGLRLLALFVASVDSGVLVGINRADVALCSRLFFTMVRCVTIPITLAFGDPMLALAAVIAATAVAETVVLRVLATRFCPAAMRRFVRPARAELRHLYGFGLQSFFALLAVKIISYTDTTVIGFALGPAAVALYVLPLQLVEYGRILVGGVSTVLLPKLAGEQVRGSAEGLAKSYLQASRVTGVLAVFLYINLIFLGAPFLRLWVGSEFANNAIPILVCLGIAGVAQALSTQVSLPFHQATDTLRRPVTILLTEAALNLVLSLVLVRSLGLTGVALSTLLPALAFTFVLLPPSLCRTLRVPFRTWANAAITPGIYLLLPLTTLHLAMRFAVADGGYPVLLLKLAAGSALALGMAPRLVGMKIGPRWWSAKPVASAG
jgi:O-antigen/teichoic acid export membrane protein